VSAVKYSPRAARALGALKQFYNDVEIYVEDTTSHNMILFICRRILGDDVRLTSVNQLGGRLAVIAACRLDQQQDGRRKLYVIDADMDLLLGTPKTRLRYLYRLRCYCIENLIVDEAAVIEVAAESSPNSPPHRLALRLAYATWLSNAATQLMPLFVAYALVRQFAPEVPTVSFPSLRLTNSSPRGPELSAVKIRRRLKTLLLEIRRVATWAEIRAEKRNVSTRVAEFSARKDYLISGKDYILPLLATRLRQLANVRSSREELKVRLAHNYDPSREPYLARRLRGM
jgi:hypothetical protein